MAVNDYARLVVEVDGRKQDQVTSIKHHTASGKIEVFTIETGLSGFTPGPGFCEVELGYAVPVGGFEEPFQKWCVEPGRHTIQIGCGPQAYVGEGEFMDNNLSMSVNGSAEGSVTWKGQKVAFQ